MVSVAAQAGTLGSLKQEDGSGTSLGHLVKAHKERRRKKKGGKEERKKRKKQHTTQYYTDKLLMSTDSCVSEMAHTHTFKPRKWRRRTFTGSTVAVLCGSSPPSDSSPSHTLSTAVLHLSLRGKRLMNLRVFLVELPSYSGCPHRPRLSQKSQAHPVLVRPWVEASPSSGDHTAATRGLRELQRVGAPSPEPAKGPGRPLVAPSEMTVCGPEPHRTIQEVTFFCAFASRTTFHASEKAGTRQRLRGRSC